MRLPWQDHGPVYKRAKAIKAARASKTRFPWDNHANTTYEFKVLDLLRDIRTLLLAILILMGLSQCSEKPSTTVTITTDAAKELLSV